MASKLGKIRKQSLPHKEKLIKGRRQSLSLNIGHQQRVQKKSIKELFSTRIAAVFSMHLIFVAVLLAGFDLKDHLLET